MLENYIEKLKPFIEEIFKNDLSGHDVKHLERTLNNALYIQKREGGDKIIIGISAYLHDIHRIMQNRAGCFIAPKDSLDMVRNILSNIDITKEQEDEICYCIEHHENYNWNGNNVKNKNALILQDADNLDAIGAVGIARTLYYSGSHGIPIHDDKISLKENNDYFEENGYGDSTTYHIYHKLLKLADYMNTKTAKKLAKKKTKIMKDFAENLLSEWGK